MEIRLYPWLSHGPLPDPAGDALKYLADGRVLDLAGATADDEEPCPDLTRSFFMFGKSARAIRLKTTTGQRVVITAGHADGSLVSIVGIIAPGHSACTDGGDMDAAITRLTATMASSGDTTRAPVSSPIIEMPNGRAIQMAPADPAPPPP